MLPSDRERLDFKREYIKFAGNHDKWDYRRVIKFFEYYYKVYNVVAKYEYGESKPVTEQDQQFLHSLVGTEHAEPFRCLCPASARIHRPENGGKS